MDKVLKDVDIVIHAAAYAHEGLSVFSPHLICKNIISGLTSSHMSIKDLLVQSHKRGSIPQLCLTLSRHRATLCKAGIAKFGIIILIVKFLGLFGYL